jgi:hypothetical protein
MDTLPRPGMPVFDIDQATLIVREAYLKHLGP